uniref:Uncharacterized protein n=1 Tax=Anguilla anguilla TaxID=7936 RepID=A0A0E9UUD1_ANGAN
MSRNARHLSSSQMMSAGMDLSITLLKIVGARFPYFLLASSA